MDLDRDLFLWINGHAGHCPPLDAAARLLTNEYFVPVSLALGLLFLWFGGRPEERDRWQWAVVVAAVSVGTANAIVALSNFVYYRERPFADLAVNLLFYRPPDSSFPSNAAALGFAMATGVWLRHRRAAWFFLVLGVLFSLARVYAGVHYPLDIVGGALVGVLAALLTNALIGRLEHIVARLLAAMRRLGVA
jgi:undecaprenyl-diphosphatase